MTAGNPAGMNNNQLANAKLIVAIGKARGESAAKIEIALVTAVTESGLQNYANSGNAQSLSLPHDAVGHDTDSLGLYQQRPSAGWGTTAQIMTPSYAIGKFYDALDAKYNPSDSAWLNAQHVQVSAFANGSNYQSQMPVATALMQDLYGSTPANAGNSVPNTATTVSNPIGDIFSQIFGGAAQAVEGGISASQAAAADLTTVGRFFQIISKPQTWIRIALFGLGSIILFFVLVKLVSQTSAGQAVQNGVGEVAGAAGVAAAPVTDGLSLGIGQAVKHTVKGNVGGAAHGVSQTIKAGQASAKAAARTATNSK